MDDRHYDTPGNQDKKFLLYILFSMFALACSIFNFYLLYNQHTLAFTTYNKLVYARGEIEELKKVMIQSGIPKEVIQQAIDDYYKTVNRSK